MRPPSNCPAQQVSRLVLGLYGSALAGRLSSAYKEFYMHDRGEGMDTLDGFIVEFERASVVHQDVQGFDWARRKAIDLSFEWGRLCLIEFMISGYDDDRRSLYEVPEVRRWMRGVADNWGDYLFWLTPGSLWTALLCMNPTMWSRPADGSLRIEFDSDTVFEQFATSTVAATTLLRKSGMKKSQVRAAGDQAEANLFATFDRKQFGDYVVLHPSGGSVVTYRQGG